MDAHSRSYTVVVDKYINKCVINHLVNVCTLLTNAKKKKKKL